MSINCETAGCSWIKLVVDEVEKAAKDPGTPKQFTRLGNMASESGIVSGIATGISKIAKSAFSSMFGVAGGGFNEGIKKFFKEVNFSDIGSRLSDELSDAFEKFITTLKFAKSGREAGKGVGAASREFFDKAGEGFGEGVRRAGDHLNDAVFDGLRKARNRVLLEHLPWVVLSLAAVVGTPLITYYLYRKAIHNIGKPRLAIEQRKITWLSPVYDWCSRTTAKVKNLIFKIKPQKKIEPIFNQKIMRHVTDITKAMKNIQHNGGFFQNVLLYGPGGTGKTMISKKIAKEAGMNYVMMSGGDLAQYIRRGEHVTEFNKLMDSVEKSRHPTVLFIDEAEGLCRDRDHLQAELLELQNAFLNRTGTQSKKFMLILATNRKDDIDPAVLDRMDYKISIDVPQQTEREKMIAMYARYFLNEADADYFFPPEEGVRIALQTEGLSGRALFKMMNAIYCKKAASDDNQLSQSLVDQTVTDFVEQEREMRTK